MRLRIGGAEPQGLVRKYGSPLYAYDGDLIAARAAQLRADLPDLELFYACKANTNPEIVRMIARAGFGIETVSPGEIVVAESVGVKPGRMTFTCGSVTGDELAAIIGKGIRVHLDSLGQVEEVGKRFPGTDISVRLNQGIGAGHHEHVITGGPDSKFGIDLAHLGELRRLCKKYRLRITGLHQHIGSNILQVPMLAKAMKVLLETAMEFPDLEHLDFGGGLGVPYRPGEKPLDTKALGTRIAAMRKTFTWSYGRDLRWSVEPGRFLVAEAGTLLVTVTDVKRNPSKTFVGVDSGMNHLVRPAMYDSHHVIENVSRASAKAEKVNVVGNICESGDFFAKDRMLAMPRVGDVLAIRNAGAYGYAMSSAYNLRPRPVEVLVRGGKAKLVRE